MAVGSTDFVTAPGAAGTLAALALADGCASHDTICRLMTSGATGRDLADFVHALCAVHGRLADVFQEAARRTGPGQTADWIEAGARAFVVERSYLARLTAAVGPLPSTPGQAESDAAFAAQRHAFGMLVRSDRAGCATGAALALMIDWHAFRGVLDVAANRAGIPIVASAMPRDIEQAQIVTPAVQRALAFGAQQAFAQHRGLCGLIEARATARDTL